MLFGLLQLLIAAAVCESTWRIQAEALCKHYPNPQLNLNPCTERSDGPSNLHSRNRSIACTACLQ